MTDTKFIGNLEWKYVGKDVNGNDIFERECHDEVLGKYTLEKIVVTVPSRKFVMAGSSAKKQLRTELLSPQVVPTPPALIGQQCLNVKPVER